MKQIVAISLAFFLSACDVSLEDPNSAGNNDTSSVGTSDTSDLQSDGDVVEQDANGSIDEGGAAIPNTNDPLVQQMYLAAAACGTLSKSTVPAGWDINQITSSGCAAWRPANWIVSGQPDQIQFLDSASGYAGWFVTAGQMAGTTWTLASATDAALQSIGQNMGSTATKHYYKEAELFGVFVADVVFSLNVNGQPAAAFMRIYLTEPNYILGSTSGTFIGFYMPQAQIQTYMCQLLQIDASVSCPSGGGSTSCTDSDCNSSCQNEGYNGGECSGDDCSCY